MMHRGQPSTLLIMMSSFLFLFWLTAPALMHPADGSSQTYTQSPTVPSRLSAACHRERVLLYSIITCYEGSVMGCVRTTLRTELTNSRPSESAAVSHRNGRI